MAIDTKYGRVTTEHGDIGEDEPVFVFRAKDRLLPELLCRYYDLCHGAGSPQRHLDGIENAREAVAAWQDEHPVKTPDSESSLAWLDE